MKKGKNVKAKRRLVFITFATVGLLILLAVSVYPKYLQILQNNKEITTLTNEYNELLATESKLKSEVTKLQNPEYLARYAKEKYLYSNEDEKIIRID